MKRFALQHARLWALLLAAALFLSFPACGASAAPAAAKTEVQTLLPVPDEDGSYTTAEDVCAYLLAYGRLPDNFITKKEARGLGWSSGSLEKYAPGISGYAQTTAHEYIAESFAAWKKGGIDVDPELIEAFNELRR